MFKRALSFLLLSVFIPVTGFAYRDVPQNSKSYPAIQNLVDQGYYPDGSFFRPDLAVPADMFWQVILEFSGFEKESATFQTPLPPSVNENSSMAQYLREAVRRGFISDIVPYDPQASISRLQAIRALNKVKGILEPTHASEMFINMVEGAAPSFKGLPAVEAAYASGFLQKEDIAPLRPHFSLTRRELATWIYNYEQGGSLKKTSVDPNYAPKRTRLEHQYPYQKRRRDQEESGKDELKTIKISVGNDEEVRLNKQDTSDIMLPSEAILKSVYSQVLKKYRFQEELTDEKKEAMIEGAITGMVKVLDDKYSSYIEPEDSESFNENLYGKFEGIGAYVEMIDDDFTITSPIKGSPAEAAGLMPGDIITKVDGKSIIDESISAIIKKIKGPAGTKVELSIRRDKTDKEITVIRGKITVPSVEIEFKESVAVISINQFNRNTSRDFGIILREQVLPKKPRGIIIDLRNNPGGFLTSAVDVGEYFLKKDQLIFTVDQKSLDKKYVSSRNGELSEYDNMVVLINEGTASAAEIVAGMLRDYDKVKIIGSKSVGKGTVQEIVNYKNGGMLKITIAKWLTPKGTWVQEDEENPGIIPDIMVEKQTPEERRAKIDRALDRGVNLILGR